MMLFDRRTPDTAAQLAERIDQLERAIVLMAALLEQLHMRADDDLRAPLQAMRERHRAAG
jgi:hypothetical protein